MRTRTELNTHLVNQIAGKPSRLLAENCPDRRVVFPVAPCTNRACPYRIFEKGYMHCTFIAAEAGAHTLEQIGEMIGVTKEGVRLIEIRGLAKLRAAMKEQDHASVRQQNSPSGKNHELAARDVAERQNKSDSVRTIHGRKLGQRRRRTA